MRILKIANVPDNRTGGMSRTMYMTGDAMAAAGHSVDYIFAPAFATKGPRPLHRYLDAWEASRIVGERLRGGSRYDLVEMHEPIAGVYGKQRRRSNDLPPVAAFSYGLEERGCAAWLEYCDNNDIPVRLRSRLTAKAMVAHVNRALAHADLVVCSNSRDIAHLEQKGFDPQRLVRHFSGVDESLLQAEPTNAALNRKRLLFVGSWILRKGIRDLAVAMEQVIGTDGTVMFTLAGTGLPEADVLRALPDAVRRNVTVVPTFGAEVALVLYQAHGVFVLPSFFEGQPLALIEAAAMGLAPIVTRIGGCDDFVRHEENGLVVDVNSPPQLAAAILRLTNEAALACRLGAAARQTAATHTWKASAQNLESAYLRVSGA